MKTSSYILLYNLVRSGEFLERGQSEFLNSSLKIYSRQREYFYTLSQKIRLSDKYSHSQNAPMSWYYDLRAHSVKLQ